MGTIVIEQLVSLLHKIVSVALSGLLLSCCYFVQDPVDFYANRTLGIHLTPLWVLFCSFSIK